MMTAVSQQTRQQAGVDRAEDARSQRVARERGLQADGDGDRAEHASAQEHAAAGVT